MRLFCFALFFLAFTIQLFAQSDYRQGYVILMNGDSLLGKVKYVSSSDVCKFKPIGGKKVTYDPTQVKAYGFFHDKRFVSRALPKDSAKGPRVFAEQMIMGYASLLHLNEKLYVEVKDEIHELPFPDKEIITIDGTRFGRDTKPYISVLNVLLADCYLRADSTPYSKREIGYLVQNFNRCKAGMPGKEFKGSVPKLRVDAQVFGGMQFAKLRNTAGNVLAKSAMPSIGFSVELSSPTIVERMAFSIDGLYSRQLFQYVEKNIVDYPDIYSEYIIRQNMFKLGGGLRYRFTDERMTPYMKLGLLRSLHVNTEVKVVEEKHTLSSVFTSVRSESRDETRVTYFAAAGFSRIFIGRFKAFLELRYEKSRSYYNGRYNDAGIYIFTGIRF